MKKMILLMAVALGIGFTGCKNEEEITPGSSFPNMFAPDPNDTSLEGKLKSDFFDNTGVYLIFSDRLGTYTDSFGNEREETVDFSWSLNTSSGAVYAYDFLEDDEKAEAAELLEKYFLPYINVEGGVMRPFSVLPLKDVTEKGSYSDKKVSYVSSIRCLGVDVTNWLGADEATAREEVKNTIYDILKSKISIYDDEISDFIAVSEEAYDAYYVYNYYEEWLDEQNVELIYEAGFLHYYPDSWGDIEYDCFPNEKNDIMKFLEAVVFDDETGFKEKWADYPLILGKYDLMKDALIKYGVNINSAN